MKALAAAIAALCLASLSCATPEFWESFQKTYSVKSGSALAKAECSTCHTQVPKHNAYGSAVRSILKSADTDVLTAVLLGKVEAADSDGDGWSNGEEIRKGSLPGDDQSKPSGTPAGTGMEMPGAMSGMAGHRHQESTKELIPKHTFHPLLVHFPIALFLFGAFLDVFGLRLKRGHIRAAALWNMAAGSVATAFAVPTGIVAAFRMGYPLTYGTPVFGHLMSGVAATLLVLGVVLWRVAAARRGVEPKSWGYFALLALASVAVSLTGYLGGELVYGN